MVHQGHHHEREQPAPQEAGERKSGERHGTGNDPADSKSRHVWWWTRLETGEKVATVLGILTLVAAIFAIPGVVELFHWKKPSENIVAKSLVPAPPGLLSGEVRGPHEDEVHPDGSVTIETNKAERLVLHRVKPDWPKGMEHKVFSALVFVDADGTVRGISADASDRQILYAITDAIGQWKFKPYLRNGKPTKFQATFYLHS